MNASTLTILTLLIIVILSISLFYAATIAFTTILIPVIFFGCFILGFYWVFTKVFD